jgi:hypothetical protein
MSGQLQAPAALPPGKEFPVPIGYESGWDPELVWALCRREKSFLYRESNPGSQFRRPSLYRQMEYVLDVFTDPSI